MTTAPLERLYRWLLDPTDRSHLKDVRLAVEAALPVTVVADVRRKRKHAAKHDEDDPLSL